jgi:hypothetical protein NreA
MFHPMLNQTHHQHHDDIARRLKRAKGHLQSVIDMIIAERDCLEIAQQLQAVEKAISQAKKKLVQDHIDHCLDNALRKAGRDKNDILEEFKKITKYL